VRVSSVLVFKTINKPRHKHEKNGGPRITPLGKNNDCHSSSSLHFPDSLAWWQEGGRAILGVGYKWPLSALQAGAGGQQLDRNSRKHPETCSPLMVHLQNGWNSEKSRILAGIHASRQKAIPFNRVTSDLCTFGKANIPPKELLWTQRPWSKWCFETLELCWPTRFQWWCRH
jgi:hypothetical protein